MALLAAIRFLTILPLGRAQPEVKEMGASLTFFPLVGLLLGVALAGLDAGLMRVWPAGLTGAILVAVLLGVTGAMHLEGFLDTCDGLGGATRERRLEIMRDHRVGAFAVAGGSCLVLLKWTALFSLPLPARLPALVLFPALSRWAMVLAIRSFPYARAQGLGSAFHDRATRGAVLAAGVIGLGGSFAFAGIGGLALFVGASLVTWLLGSWIAGLLGGLTGDTYGALNEVIEVLVLIAVTPLASTGLIRTLPDLLGALS